ncbi:MAG: SRPBCC domain-containing protein [Chloroflexota bacterium]
MSNKGLISKAATTINAPVGRVWDALTTPEIIKEFMFGTETVSEWRKGSPIVWEGVWKGKPYEDKGEILEMTPGRTLQYSHYSPLSGEPDIPANYHTVTYELSGEGTETHVVLSQDNNSTPAEVEESAKMWQKILESLKSVVEGQESLSHIR